MGVTGPLLLDGIDYMVPMATTLGCLVASANIGFKAIHIFGDATSVLLRDKMTKAPVVRFPTAKRVVDLKFYIEVLNNFESLVVIFNKYNQSFYLIFSIFLAYKAFYASKIPCVLYLS